ncbi:conserved hypothetical protein [Exiguobacterium sp. 8H]|uniref:hypothetical protein n=1 Tax=unclassified Exiguobacterium TaxID=2644629 RepID=UPI0012F04EB9|nr:MULTISPECIES: hypothetical protein [unclassified Exiguobacterium]VXB50689.1 conserved hypothetical protein [Exiguobacterium sp. 8A]VXB51732.1 conserved hypothetical protein [Exiguobacterium sp. 8H]
MNLEQVTKMYETYAQKIADRKQVYETIADTFDVKQALYPGSHVDVAPSLVIPHVIYVDSFKGTIRFFKQIETVQELMDQRKEYDEPCTIEFFGQDYTQPLDIEPVDLIISQYAGFVGQATKQYLKPRGILLCNDSHGDATLARFDETFELIGVMGSTNELIQTGLDDYFRLPKGKDVDVAEVKKTMKGPMYTKSVENYVFQKRRD